MKKYIGPFVMVILFIAVISSCALRHDSCGAYNRGGGRSGEVKLHGEVQFDSVSK